MSEISYVREKLKPLFDSRLMNDTSSVKHHKKSERHFRISQHNRIPLNPINSHFYRLMQQYLLNTGPERCTRS